MEQKKEGVKFADKIMGIMSNGYVTKPTMPTGTSNILNLNNK